MAEGTGYDQTEPSDQDKPRWPGLIWINANLDSFVQRDGCWPLVLTAALYGPRASGRGLMISLPKVNSIRVIAHNRFLPCELAANMGGDAPKSPRLPRSVRGEKT